MLAVFFSIKFIKTVRGNFFLGRTENTVEQTQDISLVKLSIDPFQTEHEQKVLDKLNGINEVQVQIMQIILFLDFLPKTDQRQDFHFIEG